MAGFVPHTPGQIGEMLEKIGIASVDDLFTEIPADLRPVSFNLPEGLTESEVSAVMETIAARNRSGMKIFAGGGYYDHYIPAAVDSLSSRSEFFTAYTPYQSEASQGTLQAIFEYQTMISRLTGLDVANASLYDGGTALYEAAAMASRSNKRNKILVCKGVNPLFRNILRTYTEQCGLELSEIETDGLKTDIGLLSSGIDENCCSVILQSPNFFGTIEDHRELFSLAKRNGAVPISVFNPALAGVLASPAEQGAEIAVAEGQPLGLPLAFGGPYLGVLAASKNHVRRMPGRIAGETVDRDGRRSYVLTLQAREQHIRRDRATSNICSNQALCALRALIYLSLLGSGGLEELGRVLAEKGNELKRKLSKHVEIINESSLHEFTVKLPVDASRFAVKMSKRGYLAGIPASLHYSGKDDMLIIAVTEKRSSNEIDAFVSCFAETLQGGDVK